MKLSRHGCLCTWRARIAEVLCHLHWELVKTVSVYMEELSTNCCSHLGFHFSKPSLDATSNVHAVPRSSPCVVQSQKWPPTSLIRCSECSSINTHSFATTYEPQRPRQHKKLQQTITSEKMSSLCQGKSSWPELVGVQGGTAAATIERENPLVNAQIVEEGSSVIENFDCTRVWVWVDEDGVVTRVPVIG